MSKQAPISVYPPEDVRDWLKARADHEQRSVSNAVIVILREAMVASPDPKEKQ